MSLASPELLPGLAPGVGLHWGLTSPESQILFCGIQKKSIMLWKLYTKHTTPEH